MGRARAVTWSFRIDQQQPTAISTASNSPDSRWKNRARPPILRVVTPLDSSIARALGSPIRSSRQTTGGCIHDSRRIDLENGRSLFLKSARGEKAPLLAAEARGLETLAPHIHTPAIIGGGLADDGTRWLALEWLDLLPLDPPSWADLGRQLTTLHAVTSDRHGLDHDNFIGATPQSNHPCESWSEFYITQRLSPQLHLALANGHALPESKIIHLAEVLLRDHQPAAALLHGDLWSGNVAALARSQALVFDPAPYHGDPETDLAMLELFGGPLPPPFLRNYPPLSPERERRRPLYDLYHALNHLNLFGSGYLPMVRRCFGDLGHP